MERELGAGGMATVWLARDLRHEREVAIKVLHPDLGAALGGDRFLSEIKTTAKLQHPHILPLLDSGEADGLLFYVMPLVTGETLRARLAREQQLPLEDALLVAREVADALAHAHSQGVIHRDIKPENILLQGGHAVVADFGIALAVQTAGGARMTQTGLSLGTPQYMSPEQAMGERTIDARSDIYALGAVTYEMLTGEPPFAGASVQSIVAKVLTEKPVAPTALRDTIPPQVEAAVLRALAKLPADRFATAASFSEALRAPSPPTVAGAAPSHSGAPAAASMRAARWPLVAGVTVALLGLAGGAWLGADREAGASGLALPLVLEVDGRGPDLRRFTVSSDGEAVAIAMDDGIAVRERGSRAYRLLPGTDGAESPSFSPDGAWIAYSASGALRKVSMRGGAPIAVLSADTLDGSRVRYGRQGQLAFEGRGGLWVVSPDGAEVRRLVTAADGSAPRFTPDGRGLFYVDERQGSRLMYYDLERDDTTQVLAQASEGELTDDGYLLFGHPQGGLFAVEFDQGARKVVGAPVPIAADMAVSSAISPFAVTARGLLVYLVGSDPAVRIVVQSAGGRLDTLPLPPQTVSYLRFSPDGSRLALTRGSARGSLRETQIYDFASKTLTRFAAVGGPHAPVWSPDGRELAFTATDSASDAEDLFAQPLDGSSPVRRLARRPGDQHGFSWVNDSTLVFADGSPANAMRGHSAIVVLDPRRERSERDFLRGAYNGLMPAVSPDGRWIVYASDEGGPTEVYLRPFPAVGSGAQWKLSSGYGFAPRWSGDGRSVYYVAAGGRDRTIPSLFRVSVSLGANVAVGTPVRVAVPEGLVGNWDVDRAGRMVFAVREGEGDTQLIAIPDWRALLRSQR
ncbi:protein kinase [Pseudogemmatithrix spongiicola]|uniref:non-specific serine/threonine protein kinase n=1 Tax=Pseudogemmatithrix spongiicola TaxID=3062599 RepID=A0AA49Q663_9BACT|nr:protein kinase [Gemmatimonadaceae bacterium 'strain 138']WKW16585.1 protein kinase [Gemmatimonadaceae bacterium 'strain 318']